MRAKKLHIIGAIINFMYLKVAYPVKEDEQRRY